MNRQKHLPLSNRTGESPRLNPYHTGCKAGSLQHIPALPAWETGMPPCPVGMGNIRLKVPVIR